MIFSSFSGALIHLLKSSLGTGILAIPRAFKSAGLMVGLFGTIVIGLLCTHTIHILVSCWYQRTEKSMAKEFSHECHLERYQVGLE